MNSIKLEYLWLDGYETPNIRSKAKYIDFDSSTFGFSSGEEFQLENVPEWGFDGSSTEQADGGDSDCVLKPVSIYRNSIENTFSGDSYIVLCEVMNRDGTPHSSNTRSKLRDVAEEAEELKMWFGIEQEYLFMDPKHDRPYGWPKFGFPSPQGRYYCGVGGDVVRLRNLVEFHAECCIAAGIPLGGTNAEVMLSQWEYQIGTAEPMQVCDDLWVARYMLEVLAERGGVAVSLSPKPIMGDWNGSGAHINFSTQYMREVSDPDYISEIIKKFKNKHKEHIAEYGIGNEDRLTGKHETQHISEFSSGDSDRGASIRIPITTAREGKGYLEDRRPAANVDPYRAINRIIKTIKGVVEL